MPLSWKVVAVLYAVTWSTFVHAADTSFVEKFQQLDPKRWYVADGWANGDYQTCEWSAQAIKVAGSNMRMTLSDKGGKQRPISCPEMHTNARTSYGLYEARMRSASGSGLNTAFFTYIGPPNGVKEWDEIDFEFLGKDPHTVNTGHYTNGKAANGKIVQLGFDASQSFHNYAFEWTPDKIIWYVDGKQVHETAPGSPMPHNPSLLFLSLWSGQPAWLGPFEYSKPVTADVQWVAFTPAGTPCAFPESLRCKK
jgi:endo-1,3-1,4-beta-glycanase ExoK